MKWESLSHRQQRDLQNEYDSRHEDAKPTEPVFEDTPESARMTVDAGNETHLYCFMKGWGQRTNTPNSKGHMRIVGSSEHVEINLPVESIPRLVSELQKLYDDMTRYDAEGRAHAERLRQYHQDKETYEKQREKALQSAFESGKITAKMIEDSLDDIPF